MQGCASSTSPPPGTWAIAIHGGAGVIDKGVSESERRAYVDSMATALELGRTCLAGGGSSLDAVELVVRTLELDPRFNAGHGAVFTYDGTHELDASIMDGSTLRCGAVAGVRTVKSPIGLARLVMEETPHVLLMGDGAEQFAATMGVERVPNSAFDTPRRREQWKKRREELDRHSSGAVVDGFASATSATTEAPRGGVQSDSATAPADPRSTYGTVGAVALDSCGRLAAATSTGGLTCKRWGRVGDTPVIGAGTYADDRCAVSCTGAGEEFIRHGVAGRIALFMELTGASATQAADQIVHHTLKPGDGAVIVVARSGEIAMPFNSLGMFRGAANSSGRFEVSLWDRVEPTKTGSPR
jgi:beta-aspartyl-peptidase (threonine type)